MHGQNLKENDMSNEVIISEDELADLREIEFSNIKYEEI